LWRQRTASRVIVLDQEGRILLFCDSDPGVAGSHWWVTPGGGIDPGESERQAAVRELAEETGLQVTESQLIGPFARRRVQHGFSDQVLDQTEAFFAVRVPHFTVDSSAFTEEEKITMIDNRWWSRRELADTDEWIWPAELLELAAWAETAEHAGAVAEVRELGLIVEESTRPV
jgi:8-oxo-dGTP pyrophosphatase MutT (NUDIX family)